MVHKKQIAHHKNSKDRVQEEDTMRHNSEREYEESVKNVSRNTLDSNIIGTPSELLPSDKESVLK